MTLSSVNEADTSTEKFLRGKYAICGVGETTYRRGSNETTRALGTWAVKNAMDDAGMTADDVDGMLSYSGNDSAFSTFIGRFCILLPGGLNEPVGQFPHP